MIADHRGQARQRLGELLHLDMQCGLRDVEFLGGPGEVQMIGEDGERRQGISGDPG